MSQERQYIADLSELKTNKGLCIELEDKEIALIWHKEKAYAINNFCPHRGGPLYRGETENGPAVRCPLHGWLFNLESGECLNMPAPPIETYKLKIEKDKIYLEL